MLYENDNYITIFTKKKCFYGVFHFDKTMFFSKAYENLLCASAVGPLMSGIYMGRTLKNRPGHS